MRTKMTNTNSAKTAPISETTFGNQCFITLFIHPYRVSKLSSFTQFYTWTEIFEYRPIFLHLSIVHTSSFVTNPRKRAILVLLPYLNMNSTSVKFPSITLISMGMTPVEIQIGLLTNEYASLTYPIFVLTKIHVGRI